MAINLGDVSKFKYLAHKVMPLVFDETLSYYEFLCKVIAKLNEVIDNENTQNATLEDFSVQMDEWNEEAIQKYNEFTAAIDLEIEQFEQSMEDRQGSFETEIGERTDGFEDRITDQQDAFEGEMRDAWNEFFETYLQTLGVVQTTGASTTDVMSQKAVTDEFNNSVLYTTEQLKTIDETRIARGNVALVGAKGVIGIANEVMGQESSLRWVNGVYSSSNGETGSTKREYVVDNVTQTPAWGIRTVDFIPNSVSGIRTIDSAYAFLLAWNGGTFVGAWNGSEFNTSSGFRTIAEYRTIDLNWFRENYSSYQFKVVVLDGDQTGDTAPDVDDVLENVKEYIHLVGENEINEDVKSVFRWETGKLSSTGQPSGSSDTTNIRTTDYIEVQSSTIWVTTGTGYICRVCFYDSEKNYIRTTSNIRETTVSYEVEKGSYIKLYAWNTAQSTISPIEGKNISVVYSESVVESEENASAKYEKVFSTSMFENIGIIGDSWTAGGIYDPNTTSHGYVGTYNSISWGKVLAREKGVNSELYASGGLTTKTWLSDVNGLSKLLADSAKNLYLICLGINDKKAIDNSTMTLGTIDDVYTSDFTQNPDTFYGNYGRIVGNILAHATNGKVVCVSIMREAERTLNEAIKAIAEKYGIPYILVDEDWYFVSDVFAGSICNGHPLAYGYTGIAEGMDRLIAKCVANNLTYFANYTGQ